MSDLVQHISSTSAFSSLLSSTTYVAVDFTASWCPPCKAIAPVYANLAKKHNIPEVLAFAKVDVDEVQQLAQQYRVSAMPTFMFFKDGQQVAVNGDALIQGADVKKLSGAVEKLGGLAMKRATDKK